MSDTTKAALDAAIEAHLAEEHDDSTIMLRGYILQAAGNGIEDTRDALIFCTSDNQGSITTLGLLAHTNINAETACFGDDDD
jgi:hypothetical protein